MRELLFLHVHNVLDLHLNWIHGDKAVPSPNWAGELGCQQHVKESGTGCRLGPRPFHLAPLMPLG